MSQLSENIKYLRETSGSTQKDFAKAFGVSRDNIASYERGFQPKLEFLSKVVNFYHISMEELVNSNLKDTCEDPKKIDLKIRPKLDLNLDPNVFTVNESEYPLENKPNLTDMIYKIQLERIENLSAENALLKKENADLRAENAILKGGSNNFQNVI